MRKFLRSLLQIIGGIVIAVGCVAALLSSMVVCAMLIAWAHDGRLLANDKPILTKGTAVLAASSVVVWLTAWLHRRFGESGDNTFRIVRSRSGQSEKISGGVFDLVFFVGLGAGLWAVIPPSQFRIPIVTGWLLIGFAGIHAHIFLHELGHLSIAWALGFNLRALHAGTGPLLYAKTLRTGMRIVWRAWPLGGFAFATDPRGKNLRLRQSLFVAGGPLMDGAILFVGYRLGTQTWGSLGEAFTRNAGSLVAGALLLHVCAAALTGIVPHTVWIGGRRLHTDGWLLLRPWLAPKGVIGFSGDPSWLDALRLLRPPAGTNKPSLMSAVSEVRMPQASFRELQARLRSGLRQQR
jgi:peptidase M50-like protein